MDHTQFLQILESCAALPVEKRQEIAEASKGLNPEQLLEFSSKLLALHAKLEAVSKKEIEVVNELEKLVKQGGKRLSTADRTRKESAAQKEDSDYSDTLLEA